MKFQLFNLIFSAVSLLAGIGAVIFGISVIINPKRYVNQKSLFGVFWLYAFSSKPVPRILIRFQGFLIILSGILAILFGIIFLQ